MYSTLLYLASGKYRQKYEELPFDLVILVDREMAPSGKRNSNSKVELISGDALPEIQKLKKRDGLKIDCLVSVNEGLSEGGGDYPIFSDFLLGYLSPILADELLVITDISYYHNAEKIGDRVAKMDWGFDAQKIEPGHPRYLDPGQFTTYRSDKTEEFGDVFILNRLKSRKKLALNTSLKMELVHGSIWEEEDELDLIGLNVKPRREVKKEYCIQRFFRELDKVYLIHNLSIETTLGYAEEQKIKHLGLTPWMMEDYTHVIEVLKKYQPKYLERITFYHLGKDDFKMLYKQVNP
jgi:hypothetical protein